MTSGPPFFDHTVQDANIWLKAVATQLHCDDRHHEHSGLRATLHALRDRQQPQRAVHFGARLPMVIRGLYCDDWRLDGKPTADHSIDEFCVRVGKELPPKLPTDARTLSCGGFQVVFEQRDPGESAKVIDHFPVALRSLWPEVARCS